MPTDEMVALAADDPFYAVLFGLPYVAPMCTVCDGPIYPDPVGKLCSHCASRTVEQDEADFADMARMLADMGMPAMA